jgi:hypothetical protein
MSIDRRQFPRLEISPEAYAVDAKGRELGKVSYAGGGGMLITANSSEAAQSLEPGKRLSVTVMEPHSQTSNRIDVVVRYRDGNNVGVEFVGGSGD